MSRRSGRALDAAVHRPATRKRRFRHDAPTGGDLFSGFGGLTQAMQRAGVDTIVAANHNAYKVEVHERNHPEVEHWIADLVDKDSPAYHDVRQLPRVDFLGAGVSCTNHTQANTTKAYEEGLTLFDLPDDEYQARVTRSEKDRATANCVLHYAAVHHPDVILVECTTELQSWGPRVPGRKYGDGSTYRWWLKQFDLLDYHVQVVYLNTMFFGVGQSRNRGFWGMTKKRLPKPDLGHRPLSMCAWCDEVVEAVWTWKTRLPPTGRVEYGKQYLYRCPRCRREVIPPMTPSLSALDLTNLGVRIGDKPIKTFREKDGTEYRGPLARSTMERAERCRLRFPEFPAVVMPAKGVHGSEKRLDQPLSTQTSQQETALLSTGAVVVAHQHKGEGQRLGAPMDTVTATHARALVSTSALMVAAGNSFERPGSDCRSRGVDEPLWTQPATNQVGLISPGLAMAVDNYQGGPRSAAEPLPTQLGSETMAVVSSGVVPFRRHTVPTSHGEAMPTMTAEQIPGLLTAAGVIWQNEGVDGRVHPVDAPLRTVTAAGNHASVLFSGWSEQSGSTADATGPHGIDEPLGMLTPRDTTALLMAQWRAELARIPLEECYFRMLGPHEIGRACGFDVNFLNHKGTFEVWGSDRDQVDGFGNAVTPAVGEWLGRRLLAALHSETVARTV